MVIISIANSIFKLKISIKPHGPHQKKKPAIREIQSTGRLLEATYGAQKIVISSWKIAKGAQTGKNQRPSAKLLEGYSGVREIEQPCYSAY